MKILIFTEGTILMHKNAAGHSRQEIVSQVESGEESVHDYASYVPIGNSPNKLKEWQEMSNEIYYLTSRTKPIEVEAIQRVLDKYDFPKSELHFRKGNETYAQVAESIMPDILVEDDCESIGGEEETTYFAINEEKKKSIKQILVKEFGGIDKVNL